VPARVAIIGSGFAETESLIISSQDGSRRSNPVPELPPDLHAAQARVIQFADKLFEALEDLRDAGGMAGFAALNPKAAGKVAATLASAHLAIDEALAQFEARRR
jgi:hypothetical protein